MTIAYFDNLRSYTDTEAELAVFSGGAPVVGIERLLDIPDVAGFALRTAPVEAADYCDPMTLEAYTAFNTAFAVRPDALRDVGGVDRRMGACAATDLLLRFKAAGYAVRYAPYAVVQTAQTPRPDYAAQLLGGLMLRCRYGAFTDIIGGKVLVLKALAHPDAYGVAWGNLLRRFAALVPPLIAVACERLGKGKKYKNTISEWNGAWPGFSRGEWTCSAAVEKTDSETTGDCPRVSVITRTRNRPETLRKTLESLRHQTYANFEIVVVEDGEPNSADMIRTDFADLPIRYRATVENIGRAAAFNLGVSLASGELLNMLDDDDFLLPEHLALGVAALKRTGGDMLFLRGMALETDKLTDEPYTFAIRAKRPLDFPRIEPFTMVRRCLTTEQGVLFKKSLCVQVGGMRPELHAHEDWNLWLRMMAAGKFSVLPYVTNCYIVPFDKAIERVRLEKYSQYDGELLADEALVFHTTPAERAGWYASVLHDLAYLETLGALQTHMAQETNAACLFLADRAEPVQFDALADAGDIDLSGLQLKELYCTLILDFAQKGAALSAFLRAELARLKKEEEV